MNRRPSLPGVEELFGTGGRAPSGGSGEDAEPTPNDVLTAFARFVPPEDAAVAEARERAGELAPFPEVLDLLRWAALTCGARTVVEVGAAGGVTALALSSVLPAKGVVTSIEPEPAAHGPAAEAHRQLGAPGRIRSIQDDPLTVLPRLSDGGYDLVLLQSEAALRADLLDHVRRLLRVGGVLMARGVAIVRPGQAAEFVGTLVDDEGFRLAVLPMETGLVLATRLPEPESA